MGSRWWAVFWECTNLLLSGLAALSGLLSLLSEVAELKTGLDGLSVSRSLLLIGGDGTGLLAVGNSDERKLVALLNGNLNLLGGSNILALDGRLRLLTLLDTLASLVGVSGEDDQLGAVDLEALNVSLQALLVLVLATVVNGNTKLTGLVLGKTGTLELSKGESTASANTARVLSSASMDDGADGTSDGLGEDTGGLGLSVKSSAELAGRLVEPGLNTTIPILMEVGVRDHVVVSHHLFFFPYNQKRALMRFPLSLGSTASTNFPPLE
jgi:hypothetical protein